MVVPGARAARAADNQKDQEENREQRIVAQCAGGCDDRQCCNGRAENCPWRARCAVERADQLKVQCPVGYVPVQTMA